MFRLISSTLIRRGNGKLRLISSPPKLGGVKGGLIIFVNFADGLVHTAHLAEKEAEADDKTKEYSDS